HRPRRDPADGRARHRRRPRLDAGRRPRHRPRRTGPPPGPPPARRRRRLRTCCASPPWRGAKRNKIGRGGVVVTVFLVGAGPGDPGLLTVRGAEVLARADVVVYDRLSVVSLLDRAPAGAERISVGKSPGHVSMGQEEIHALP